MTPYVVNEEEGDNKKQKRVLEAAANGDVLALQDDTGSSSGGEAGTPIEGPLKPLVNGKGKALQGSKATRGGALKRVSFGSSKGSMVETLVYDHSEELRTKTPVLNGKSPAEHQLIISHKVPTIEERSGGVEEDSGGGGVPYPSRLKVTFFECQRPTFVTTPESPDTSLDFFLLHQGMASSPTGKDYNRQHSTDSGLDNPFRPDGELSREADTIVTLIKEGKPITPVKSEPEGGYLLGEQDDQRDGGPDLESLLTPKRSAAPLESSCNAKGGGANGTAPPKSPLSPGVVEVQHGIVVPPSDASQVEQVVIKKKPKCKCCVIQ